ncbi:MAG: leucine-rich repeat protein [Alistipes sp.]|nr:leucine-rich repeat protein [Alistipes sp.]
MKRLFTLLLIAFSVLSCEMVDEKLDNLLDKRDWVVFADGTELTVDVPSKQTVLNYKFESTLDWKLTTESEWLEIDKTSGKAGKDIKIQIKVLHNKNKEGRTGYVDLTLSNSESYRITVNQAGEGEENDDIIVDIPNNEIWYTSVDGEIVEPYSGEHNNNADALKTFGANIVSNTYINGKGVITFDGDVATIGDWAFYNCTSLTNITIPDSVTEIGYCAFITCTSLTNITIPDSVISIGNSAFRYCYSLRSVTIGNSVTKIGESAFYDCSSLTNVTIGNSVTEIGEGAFAFCYSLTSVTIPGSVTEIGKGAFESCTSLTSFYGKFASVDNRCLIVNGKLIAFAIGCGATEYTIPDSVTSIGVRAFRNCTSLTSVTIPGSVTSIGVLTFAECTSLTSITIPDSVTEIGNNAFDSCTSLTSVTIPDSVTEIGEWAFVGCDSLTSVTIGNSVTSIGRSAFRNCTSLTSVTIPDSVTTIGEWAFDGCDSLTSVTIGNSVTSIGEGAFEYCTSLKEVYCKPTTPPSGDSTMFGYYSPEPKIYVPRESVKAYKSAEYWSNYADYIVGYDF